MGKGAKGGGTQTTTQTNAPPAYLQPIIKDYASQAFQLQQNATPQLYNGSYTVDPSQTSQDALSQLEAYGRNPSALENNSTNYVNGVLSGNYLNSNPYIDAIAERAGRSLTNQYRDAVTGVGVDAAGVGRYGSGLYQKAVGDKQDALGQGLTDLNSSIYYQNYNDERNRQQQALSLAPAINQQGLDRANVLASVGATRDNLAQQKRDEEISRFEYNRDFAGNNLDQAIQRIMSLAGNYGTSTQTSTAPKTKGGLGSALSGGIGGASLGAQLGLGQLGMFGGGALGALGGLLG